MRYVFELTGARGPATREHECDDDAAALNRAARILAHNPVIVAVYVFSGDRRVGHVQRQNCASQ
jgi:hypothetical protein